MSAPLPPPGTHPAPSGVQSPAALTARLWSAVTDGDEEAAINTVLTALDDGADAESLLLDVIAPVQARVGTEWAANRITVAQEHAATAINDRAVAALSRTRHGTHARAHTRGRLTVACVDGEWHALPARILAEVLNLRGWRVDFLGAQVPTPHLIAHLHRTNPAAVLLSASIPTHLPTAHAAISACQAVGVPVLAGGAAFGPDGRYAHRLSADAWAPDARAAATLVAAGIARPAPGSAHQPIDDLPHLADQEYTLVTQNRHQLVKQALADLEARFPAMRAYTDAQREHTAEDIAHIVGFLTIALYVDDADLFTGFLTWTAEILTHRNVPAHSLLPVLESLTEQLKDFPRSLDLLRHGRTVLPRPGKPA
jgi:methanogenic corrinoid protein MtbC1